MNPLTRPFRYRYDHVALILIGINILVFLLQQLYPALSSELAMNPILVRSGWFWQPLTYMFVHGGISHLVFNMLALFIFGDQVERRIGSREFLLYYLVTGLLAGLFSLAAYLLTGAYYVFLLGASGAIFAVQLAYATLFPNAIVSIWGILPLRAPIMVLVFTVIELVSSLTGLNASVAHLTHLAGFGFGWLYCLIRIGANPWRALRSPHAGR
jgi:membrane associated rhomboid family serine protease